MLNRIIISTYKFYNINNSNKLKSFYRAPLLKATFIHSSAKMSTENKTVLYEDVVSATKNSSIYIIDVREPQELMDTGKIPNSINIPLGEVENALKTYTSEDFENKFGRSKPSVNTPIIFTCKSGKRAGMALDAAVKLGFIKSKNYEGSWLDWEKHQ